MFEEKKKQVNTSNAPAAIGPYSQAIVHDKLIFISGQIPIEPKSNTIAEDNIIFQTRQVLDNIKKVIEAAGSNMDSIIKTTVFLKDINDFAGFNDVYKEYFTEPYPARSTVEVSNLPKDVRIEIEAVGYV